MPGLLDGERFEFGCPECGSTVRTTIGRVRRSPTVRCPRGHSIQVDASQFDREMQGADRAFRDFERSLRRLSR